MARFTPLFSGSKGNCVVIGGADSFILIDAGVSAKRITEALRERGLDISRLTGIFVTHEHSDHISGVRVLASKHKLPVFANRATLDKLEADGHLAGTGGGVEIFPRVGAFPGRRRHRQSGRSRGFGRRFRSRAEVAAAQSQQQNKADSGKGKSLDFSMYFHMYSSPPENYKRRALSFFREKGKRQKTLLNCPCIVPKV